MALTSALNYRSKIDISIFKIATEFDSLLSNIDCGNVLFGLVDHDEHTGLFWEHLTYASQFPGFVAVWPARILHKNES